MTDLLLLRADGGTRIGYGHILRSLALAQAWQRNGGRAIFAVAESTVSLEARLRADGIEIARLNVTPGSNMDAKRTAELATELGALWVAADGYGFGDEWQRSIKGSGMRLLLWDDYGHSKSYSADLILNQNVYATVAMYVQREPNTKLLLGAHYAQLRSEFLKWRDWKREIPPVPTKVLVTMGGSDPENVTGEVVTAMASIKPAKTIVVAGGGNPNIDQLRSAVATQANMQLEIDSPNMPELMAWADIAVSAGGSACLELAFMGLPAVITPIAANQKPGTDALGQSGLAIVVPSETDNRKERLTSCIRTLCSSPREKRSAMSDDLRRLVDGRGPERVLRFLQAGKVLLRPVVQDDCALMWQWANDSAVRSWSFHSDPIPWDDHVRWFASKCGKPNSIWFVAHDLLSCPVGQVRIDLESAEIGVVNFSVASEQRGRGFGTSILCAVLEEIFLATALKSLRALVKCCNRSSVRSFERAGFTKTVTNPGSADEALQFVFRREEY